MSERSEPESLADFGAAWPARYKSSPVFGPLPDEIFGAGPDSLLAPEPGLLFGCRARKPVGQVSERHTGLASASERMLPTSCGLRMVRLCSLATGRSTSVNRNNPREASALQATRLSIKCAVALIVSRLAVVLVAFWTHSPPTADAGV